jgi:hypothetical protein
MKSLIWKIQRMQMMSPAEMGVRASREVRNLVEYVLLASGLSRGPGALSIDRDDSYVGSLFEGKFFFDLDDETLRSALSPLSDSCLNEAEGALAHRVSVLGREYDLGERIDWHLDRRLNRRCPVLYWSLIDLKNPDFEESIRWVWYVNRHRHLGALGRAYFVTRKPEYAQEIVSRLCEWIEQNPPSIGVNWAASLEIALRLFSWVWAVFPLKDFDGLTPQVEETIMQSMGLQMRHMFRNLSTHSSANNHLIAQGMSLFVVGTLLQRMRGAARWRDRGLSILWGELLKQTYTDGVSKEQSIHYHCFVVEMYSIVFLFARRNGIDVPEPVKERFAKMCEFVLDVSTRHGGVPSIGDSDDQAVMLPEEPRLLFRALMGCAGYLTGKEKFLRDVTQIPYEASLLLGRDGAEFVRERIQRLPEEASQGESRSSRAFSEGGYYVLSGQSDGIENRCVFDCGELGLGRTAAHGHADCLSVTLNTGESEVLIDPGTFTYHSRPEWRTYFRSTCAHNTVTVDGQSQSDMLGPFVWKDRAAPRLEDAALESCFDLVAGSHDGYLRLSDPVKHRRVLVFIKPSFLIIVDELSGKSRHEYEQNFHFGNSASLHEPTGSARVLADGEQLAAMLFSPAIKRGKASLVAGREEPAPLGWRSERFWQKAPCDCLSIKGEFEGSTILDSCVENIGAKDSVAPVVWFSDEKPEGRRHSVFIRETPSFKETSLINLDGGLAGEECLQSDASYVCLREYPATNGIEIFGRNVGNVVRGGETLLESAERFVFMRVLIEEGTVKFEARGSGTILVRTDSAGSVVSPTPGVDYERKGRFVRVSVEA